MALMGTIKKQPKPDRQSKRVMLGINIFRDGEIIFTSFLLHVLGTEAVHFSESRKPVGRTGRGGRVEQKWTGKYTAPAKSK